MRSVFFFEDAGGDEGHTLDNAPLKSKWRAQRLEHGELDVDSECEMQFVFVFYKCEGKEEEEEEGKARSAQRLGAVTTALQKRLVRADGKTMRTPCSGCWAAPQDRSEGSLGGGMALACSP